MIEKEMDGKMYFEIWIRVSLIEKGEGEALQCGNCNSNCIIGA